MPYNSTSIHDRVLWTLPGEPWATERWYRLATEYGWRKSHGAITCPAMVLLGRNCRGSRGRTPCICVQIGQIIGPIWSHSRRWLDVGRLPIITLEPAGTADDPRIAAVVDLCTSRGISVEIGERSPRNPGKSVLLVLREAEPQLWTTR